MLGTPMLSTRPTQKQGGKPGEGWLRSPYGQRVLKFKAYPADRWPALPWSANQDPAADS